MKCLSNKLLYMKYLKVKYFLFIIRLLLLKIKFGNKIILTTVRVGIENGTNVIIIGKTSSIKYGDMNYFYRFGNLEVFDGGEIVFDDYVSINKGFSIVCRSRISFGKNVIVGPNVMIYDHDHNFKKNTLPFRLQGYRTNPISIGDNVWIGANVFISSGVNIGSGSVIAAGSVVTSSIPDNSVVAGNPGKVIKFIA